MPTLISGGTGFIGAEIARVLVNRGEGDVTLFDITDSTHRLEDIDKVTRGYRASGVDGIRWDDGDRTGGQTIFCAVDCHVERSLEQIRDLFMRVGVFG